MAQKRIHTPAIRVSAIDNPYLSSAAAMEWRRFHATTDNVKIRNKTTY
jgi:hypothetical protein